MFSSANERVPAHTSPRPVGWNPLSLRNLRRRVSAVALAVLTGISAQACGSATSGASAESFYPENESQASLWKKREALLELRDIPEDVREKLLAQNRIELMAANLETIKSDYEAWMKREMESKAQQENDLRLENESVAHEIIFSLEQKKRELQAQNVFSDDEIDVMLESYLKELMKKLLEAKKQDAPDTPDLPHRPSWDEISKKFTPDTQEKMFQIGRPRFLYVDQEQRLVIVDGRSTPHSYLDGMYITVRNSASAKGYSLLTLGELFLLYSTVFDPMKHEIESDETWLEGGDDPFGSRATCYAVIRLKETIDPQGRYAGLRFDISELRGISIELLDRYADSFRYNKDPSSRAHARLALRVPLK